MISYGVCAESELIALRLSGGVEIDELEVLEGKFHAVLEDGLSVDDIIIKSGSGAVACSGDGVELVGMVDVVPFDHPPRDPSLSTGEPEKMTIA
ncbi:MAG: hypothetical protein ABGZ31_09715 [Roseibacillus sp.]